MEIYDILEAVNAVCGRDPAIRRAVLATREAAHPIEAFCRLVRDMGYPLYEMDIIAWGEDNYAAMRRSTNGGGENSPALSYEDDYYELFIAELAAE